MASRNRESISWLYPMLYKAYSDARRGKRGTLDEQRFERHADVYLSNLQEDIERRSYRPSHGIAFIVHKPVIREIFAAPFRDRVVHHLIFNMVGDWWDRRFIYDNYSCRKNKGTLFAVKRLDHHIRSVSQNYSRPAYVLKLDVQGYFMSLPRTKLYEIAEWGIRRQFHKDTQKYRLCRFLWEQIIFDNPTEGVHIRGTSKEWATLPKTKSLFNARKDCGIVIGNLTSQLLSNMYLDQLDRYVTMGLGMKHYGRYVDDFFIVSEDKEKLKCLISVIRSFLEGLGLTLHPRKIRLQEICRGVPFLGAEVYPYRIHPNQRVRGNLNTAVKEYMRAGGELLDLSAPETISLVSYYGITKHYRHQKMWAKAMEVNDTDLGGLRT